jgi:hypothetical protein
VLTIQISAGRAELKYARQNFDTPRRTLEILQALETFGLEKSAREIREKRERDERRGLYP